MTNVEIFTGSLLDLYDSFLKVRADAGLWKQTQTLIHQWVTDRQGRK
jgi:hypothetical protein